MTVILTLSCPSQSTLQHFTSVDSEDHLIKPWSTGLLIQGYKPTVAHPTVIVRSSRVCYAQCLYKLSVLYNDDCGHLYSLVINRGRQLSLWVIHGRLSTAENLLYLAQQGVHLMDPCPVYIRKMATPDSVQRVHLTGSSRSTCMSQSPLPAQQQTHLTGPRAQYLPVTITRLRDSNALHVVTRSCVP